MKVSELIEKLKEMPQDAFVVTGTAADGYKDIGDICDKIGIVNSDDLRRYELGIISDEDIDYTPVISIEPGEGLSIFDNTTQQFSYSSVDDLFASLLGDSKIEYEVGEPVEIEKIKQKPQWEKTNPDSELLMQSDGIISINSPDYPDEWGARGAKARIKTRDIKTVDEFVWHADFLIDNDSSLDGTFTPCEIAHEKNDIKIRNRMAAVDYLNDGYIFSTVYPVDIYGEIRDMTAGDYTKSVQEYIDHFIVMRFGSREKYEKFAAEERRLDELGKDPEFLAQVEDALSLRFPEDCM